MPPDQAPPDPEVIPPVAPPVEEPSCDTESAVTLYLSADDSNSMAGPVLARQAIRSRRRVSGSLRIYEFLNYYDFDDEAAPAGEGRVTARRMFAERFLSNLEVAARDVRVELTMPPTFSMFELHGEEYSENPQEVEPQHLAPNDALARLGDDADLREIEALLAAYLQLISRAERSLCP